MSTMISFSDNNLSNNFLTEEELRKMCPSAYKTTPTNPKVSERYVQANTATVISDLGKLGWYPVQAKQCKMKKNSSGIRSFHMIAFQNPNVKIIKPSNDGGETVDAYPRIILTNSHDGFNSFKFMVGIFRLVCSNGLVIATDEMVNMSIRHINYDFETLRGIVATAIKQVPDIVDTMNTMKHTTITDEAKKDIATSVLKIRKDMEDNENFVADDDTIDEILEPLRDEDNANDLWTVFNICQEKLIKGGFRAVGKNNRFRKQRRISSIKKDIEYNQKLWAVASKYIPVPVAA